MYDFKVQLSKIKNDRQSGSLQISNNTLNVIQEAISARDINIHDLKAMVVDLSSDFPDFAVLQHFISGINQAGNTKRELLDFISNYKQKWQNVDRDISNHFLSSIKVNDSTVLLHSNSRTIHALFEEITRRNLTVNVFQTESRPGGEGVLQAEYLRKLGFKVSVINDDVLNQINSIDIFLIGADRIEPENVINKVGSSAIARLFIKKGKPVFVLADSRKKTKIVSSVMSESFEKISRKLITVVITENG